MSQEEISPVGPRMAWTDALRSQAARVRQWPPVTRVYLVSLICIAAPILWLAAQAWLHDENQAHGIFIVPLSLYLLWIQRDALRQAALKPVAWGLAPLALGLLLHLSSWLLRVQTQFISIWALVLILYGSILILHGNNWWRIMRFPVLFLLTAGGIPGKLIQPLSNVLQRISSDSAAFLMNLIGFTISQQGNVLEVPGCQLEVADACSGLKKVVALFAFSLVYGYLFRISMWKRVLLAVLTVPIALLANILRVCGLVAVANFGGIHALHLAHDGAEIVALIIAFFLFVGAGKVIGCKTLRFSL